MTIRLRPTTLAMFLALAAAPLQPAAGQDADWDRWSVSIAIGPTRGGPAKTMSRQLAGEGWDDDMPGLFRGSLAFPFHQEPEPGSAIRVGYRFRPGYGVALMRAKDLLGYASGYRDNETLGNHLGFQPSVRTLAVLGSFFPTGAHEPFMIRLDAGPALYDARIGRDGVRERRLGLVLGGGAGLRVWKLRLSVDLQTRQVGELEYGPLEVVNSLTGEVDGFGEHRANFDHTTILFGLGLTL